MKIIAGLGNPGRRYGDTRHNLGWMALERLAEGSRGGDEQYLADGVLLRWKDLGLFKPLLYMNRSGPPMARLMAQLRVGIAQVLVLTDDLALPLGALRLRPGGSSGGHNGLASVIEALGTEEFPRLRMGIGPRPDGVPARDFVLSPFADDEWDLVEDVTERAARAATCWAEDGIEAAMNRFNSDA